MSVEFQFQDREQAYLLHAFQFINTNDDDRPFLVPDDEIDEFGREMEDLRSEDESVREFLVDPETERGRRRTDIERDGRETYYSFTDEFVAVEQNFPLVLPVATESNGGPDRTGDERFRSLASKAPYEVKEVEVRLTGYGIGIVRIEYDLHLENASDLEDVDESDDEVDKYIESVQTCRNEADSLAKEVWNEFMELWNDHASFAVDDQDAEEALVDRYPVIYLRNTKVNMENQDMPLPHVKRGEHRDTVFDDDTWKEIQRRIIGLAQVSRVWRDYTDEFVANYMETDLSTTYNEYQFVDWQNSVLIYHEGAAGETSYSDYLRDMVLSLELLFTIQCSLRTLEMLIDDRTRRTFPEKPDGWLRSVNPLKLREYYDAIEDFDRWLMVINDWRKYDRYGYIAHFHDFLKTGFHEMRIDEWLATIDDKLNQMNATYRVRSERLETYNLIVLTVVLVVLTILQIV